MLAYQYPSQHYCKNSPVACFGQGFWMRTVASMAVSVPSKSEADKNLKTCCNLSTCCTALFLLFPKKLGGGKPR